jgi:hypothetical protein
MHSAISEAMELKYDAPVFDVTRCKTIDQVFASDNASQIRGTGAIDL